MIKAKVRNGEESMAKYMSFAQPHSLALPEKYAGKWVALKDDKVVGSGRTVRDALAAAARKGEKHPTLAKVPKNNEYYFF